MRYTQLSPGIHNWIFDDGEKQFAVELVDTADQKSIQLLCETGEFVDLKISELAGTLAGLLFMTGQSALAREVNYRIVPGIKEV